MRRLIIALLAGLVPVTASVASTVPADGTPTWSALANGPGRFVAAHGERSAIFGYPQTGLEIWAYPLQLLSGYQVRFRESGRIEPFEGQLLLSRIETSPSEVIRIYNGPDFVVREHLFVPLNQPAAILSYEVEGRPDVQIEARFEASLDLMWPGALGGQEVAWNDSRSGYVEREPVHGFSAFIRSPEAVAHDSTVNVATNRPAALGLVMAPRRDADGVRRAALLVSQDEAGTASPLEDRAAELRAQADAHYASVLANAVEITTPDPAVNRALEASILAVDEAWVCAPQIGCGNVGGYGPSRPGRRPQYAWFFAGDGLVAVESLLASGRYERARDELEFIAKYQNKSNGMIWHEMSTSAPLIDWEKRYPYMYVHVDITLQYLSTLSDYVETTGDTGFLKSHWPGILAAWHYARSLVDRRTGLPSIPAGKEGQNEQAVLRDDVSLSVAWIEAAKAFASLARVHGDAGLARVGEQASAAALKSVRDNYWDEANGFWFGGHTASGEPLREHRSGAVDILAQGAFTPAQADRALDRLASPDFQTDWGIRSLPASDPDYDPNAYSAGAVWGLGSSSASTIFWTLHRPFTGWNSWHGLVAWAHLDSPGHMHEVVAGDLFHPELESVPEQTWSSAGFVSAAVHGLLGLDIHAATRIVDFAPHLPAEWGEVSIRRLRVGSSQLDLRLSEDANATGLQIDNRGAPVTIEFDPQIPLGARLLGAEVNGVSTTASAMQTPEDQHAKIRVTAGPGVTRAVIRYSGGVRIEPVETAPAVGDSSVNLKLASAEWLTGDVLKLRAYVVDPAHAAIDLLTPMMVTGADGADVNRTGTGRYRLTLHIPPAAKPGVKTYAPVDVMVKLQNR
jgi:glycogen debranching enzyme